MQIIYVDERVVDVEQNCGIPTSLVCLWVTQINLE